MECLFISKDTMTQYKIILTESNLTPILKFLKQYKCVYLYALDNENSSINANSSIDEFLHCYNDPYKYPALSVRIRNSNGAGKTSVEVSVFQSKSNGCNFESVVDELTEDLTVSEHDYKHRFNF